MKFEQKSLGEVSEFLNNLRKPVTRSQRQSGPYPYYGAAGIQDYVSDYLFDGKYILVGEDGTVVTDDNHPVVQIADGKFWVNNHAHVIRPVENEDFDYLYYALTNSSIGDLVSGAVQPKLSMTNLKSLNFDWPSSGEFRGAIGRVLRGLDDKILANQRLSKILEEISRAIFKSWFVYFEPVKAKMAGEKPVGMDDATAALFPDSIEHSELGPIPKGWRCLPVGEIFEVGIGRTPPRKEPEWFCDGGNGIDWVSIRDMGTYGVFADGTNEGLTEEAVRKFRVPIVPKGTVLMSFKLTVGKLCITDHELVTNEAIAHFKELSNSSIGSIFTYLWLANQNMANLDSTSSIGTATNSAIVKGIKILVPSESVHAAFVNVVGPIFDEIANLTMQTTRLAEIRDSLLPRLISGELQIPEEMLVS
jgi:type I restriction enzyme S subunit